MASDQKRGRGKHKVDTMQEAALFNESLLADF
jgi:hypothetical protein